MSFLKSLFGIFSRPNPSAASPARSAGPAVAGGAAARERQVFIGREELFDSESRIAGYLLRPRPLLEGAGFDAGALAAALIDEGIPGLARSRQIILPLAVEQWRAADFSACLTPQFALQLASADELAALGGGVGTALDWTAIGSSAPDIALVDLHALPLAELESGIAALRRRFPAMRWLARNVHSWEEFRYCMSHGFALCSGSFTATVDAADAGKQVSQARLVVIEMLNQLRAGDDIQDIATTAKRDPSVVIKLLEMVNSPFYGASREVASIEEAILLLGRDALYRWLSLALFRVDGGGGRDEALLVIALSRAFFLESLSPDDSRQHADELFLVGLLSLVDVLLGLPIGQVAARMRLPQAVEEALCSGRGPYAGYLRIAQAMAQCQLREAVLLASVLQIDSRQLIESYSQALRLASGETAVL